MKTLFKGKQFEKKGIGPSSADCGTCESCCSCFCFRVELGVSLCVATVNCCMFLADRFVCVTNYTIDSCVGIGSPQRRLAKKIIKNVLISYDEFTRVEE